MSSNVEQLAEWWESFDGPAYPTGPEFAALFLASDWLAARLAAARAEGAAEALSDCSRCSKPASAVGSPDDLPVCQGCAVQVGAEAVAERVNAVLADLRRRRDGHWQRFLAGGSGAAAALSQGKFEAMHEAERTVRAALDAGEDLPQGEPTCPDCNDQGYQRLACSIENHRAVTGQERGQDA